MNALKIKIWTKLCPLNLTNTGNTGDFDKNKYLRIVKIEARFKYKYAEEQMGT